MDSSKEYGGNLLVRGSIIPFAPLTPPDFSPVLCTSQRKSESGFHGGLQTPGAAGKHVVSIYYLERAVCIGY
jgi:hypothetical protein